MNQDCQSCYARIGDLQWLLYNENKAYERISNKKSPDAVHQGFSL